MFEVGDIVRIDSDYLFMTKRQLQKRYKIIETALSSSGNSYVTVMRHPKNRNYKKHIIPIQFVSYDSQYYRREKIDKICSRLEM